jgi:hypothetical protein
MSEADYAALITAAHRYLATARRSRIVTSVPYGQFQAGSKSQQNPDHASRQAGRPK